MPGRILLIMIMAATAIACTRKQSLYIDPGKADSPVERAAQRWDGQPGRASLK